MGYRQGSDNPLLQQSTSKCNGLKHHQFIISHDSARLMSKACVGVGELREALWQDLRC